MRTKREQVRPPTGEVLENESMRGPHNFPQRHPDMECVLVIKRKPDNPKYQTVSDHLAYKRMGYEILSDDEQDTWDPDFVWMGIPKSVIEERRKAIEGPVIPPSFEPIGEGWGAAARRGYAAASERGYTLEEMEQIVLSGKAEHEKMRMAEEKFPEFFKRLEEEVEQG